MITSIPDNTKIWNVFIRSQATCFPSRFDRAGEGFFYYYSIGLWNKPFATLKYIQYITFFLFHIGDHLLSPSLNALLSSIVSICCQLDLSLPGGCSWINMTCSIELSPVLFMAIWITINPRPFINHSSILWKTVLFLIT